MLHEKIKKVLDSFGIKVEIDVLDYDIETENAKYGVKLLKDYNLLDVASKINFVQDYLKVNLKICKLKDKNYHFGLIKNCKSNNDIINFNDEKYDFIFDEDLGNKNDIFFGVDKNGFPIVENIKDLPHILIAGTTGSGKSVSVNSIICSILKSSDIIKNSFVMIDTKIVELSMYKKLPNCQIATNVEDALELLEDIDIEIDARYKVMEKNNEKIMPDYVSRKIVVIEELADLMFASKKEVEKYIVRIAQLGRACGVHLIVATQRPTVNVVTGLIKANIGCRLALKTTSDIDSRVIIDESGAENLKGKGDCLLKLPEKSKPIHIQCPYISDDEIRDIIKLYKGENL